MKVKANAKINFTLDICGKRDDGYHLLDSVEQSVSLCDTVTVEKSEIIAVDCSDGELCGDENIATLAAKSFFDATGICGGAKIYIEKRIPKAAGLGGGSADAAAVIMALDRIYETDLNKNELIKIALSVGADVPFCLFGGTKRVEGIGEKITDIPQLCDCGLVLLKYGQKQSTGDMYRRLDTANAVVSHTEAMISALSKSNITEIAQNLGNAFLAVNDIDKIKAELLKTAPVGVSLSGSGPTVFGIYKDMPSAVRAEELLRSQGFTAFAVLPERSGVIFE